MTEAKEMSFPKEKPPVLLERCGQTALFMTRKQYTAGHHDFFEETPVYHVRSGQAWVIATQNYHEAYMAYQKCIEEEKA